MTFSCRKPQFRRRSSQPWSGLAISLALLAGPTLTQAAAPACNAGATAPFTADQVKRGQAVYSKSCAVCHGAALEGPFAPALKGADFQQHWQTRSVDDFLDYVASFMPSSKPGTLDPDDYAGVVAFLLSTAGKTAGSVALAAGADGMTACVASAK